MLTKAGLIAKEQGFWDHVAPIGTVFSIGVVMGFIVGLAICYQVLFSDISERLAEFATLKAMGYSDLRLVRDHRGPVRLPGAAGLPGRAGCQPGIVRRRPRGHRPADGPARLGCRGDPRADPRHVRARRAAWPRRRLTSADPAELFRCDGSTSHPP